MERVMGLPVEGVMGVTNGGGHGGLPVEGVMGVTNGGGHGVTNGGGHGGYQ